METSSFPVNAWQRPLTWFGCGVLAVGFAVGAAFCWPPAKAEPAAPPRAPVPALSPSPFRNTSPDVAYVGDQACAGCHRDIHTSFRHHPMGESFFSLDNYPEIERYDQKASNPFTLKVRLNPNTKERAQ